MSGRLAVRTLALAVAAGACSDVPDDASDCDRPVTAEFVEVWLLRRDRARDRYRRRGRTSGPSRPKLQPSANVGFAMTVACAAACKRFLLLLLSRCPVWPLPRAPQLRHSAQKVEPERRAE